MRFRDAQGELVEATYVGQLAAQLGKSSHTVRRWHRLGHLPPTPLLDPVRGGPPRRLYTEQMIAGIVRIAAEEGLVGKRPARLADTNFRARCHELFWELFPEG